METKEELIKELLEYLKSETISDCITEPYGFVTNIRRILEDIDKIEKNA